MKTLKLTSLFLFVMIILTSCQTEENPILQEATAKALLNSYELQRNSDGTYYMNYNIKGTSDVTIDTKKSESNINIYNNGDETNNSIKENLNQFSNADQFRVKFNDTKLDKVTSILVKDENITFGREDNELLDSFNFKSNEDGSYDLDFTVVENVKVDFVFNEELQSYDIVLSEGNSENSNFLRTFNADADGNLKIAFVTNSTTSRDIVPKRKPELIIGG